MTGGEEHLVEALVGQPVRRFSYAWRRSLITTPR
jgi:hypothetical protein